MAEVTIRQAVKSDSSIYSDKQLIKGVYKFDQKSQIDGKMSTIEDKYTQGVVELEGSKRELTKMKAHNQDLEKQIVEAENEKKGLQTKIGTLKVKLGLANANLNTTNDEKEALRTKLEEAQITVARLEERLSHAISELDRLRDPANPDSNMSIKKHIVNDKKEIKRLKAEIENEISALENDNVERQKRHEQMHILERELAKRQSELETLQLELKGVRAIEEAERQKKAELVDLYGELNHERKSYPARLKHLKVRLGISNAGQNVTTRLADDMKTREKEMQRELNGIERKLKEANGALEILRNQHKMSKTAQSINEYTRRNQIKKGVEDIKSMAQSGPGPIKFGAKKSSEKSKVKSTSGGSMQSISETSSRTTEISKHRDNISVKSQQAASKLSKKPDTDRSSIKRMESERTERSDRIVPPPRAKLKHMKAEAMGDKSVESTVSQRLVQKMFELEQAYREIDIKDRELNRYRRLGSAARSNSNKAMQDKDKELARLQYNVSKLEEKLKIARTQAENAKRDLRNEKEGREIVDKKFKSVENENKDLKVKMGAMRIKLGVAQANYNVSKQELDEMKAKHQENQIQIARLEERAAAANQELERLRNPLNPGSVEETRKAITTDKKELKRLKAEVDRLTELREIDQQALRSKEEEIRQLEKETDECYERIANLEADLEQAEMDIKTERSNRENYETQNNELRKEKQLFDDIVQMYKVKLGITQAGKNVNHRQAEHLRKKDEEYQIKMRNYETQLRAAHAEIERLKVRTMPNSTANSVAQHTKRFRKQSQGFEGFGSTGRVSYQSPSTKSGWTPQQSPVRTPQMSPFRSPHISPIRSRVDINSSNSINAQTVNTQTPGRKTRDGQSIQDSS